MKNKTTDYLFLIVITSWIIFPSLWQFLDQNTFTFLNKFFSTSSYQNIIAWINSRYGDWLFESSLLVVYLFYIFSVKTKKKKNQRIFQLLFLILLIFTVQIVVNTVVFRKILSLTRLSPSKTSFLYCDFSIFKYPHNHVFTARSFPSDRSTTQFLCSLFAFSHFRFTFACIIFIFSISFAIPRLIVGAHWLSDVILGGFILAYIIWAFFTKTPIYKNLENWLLKKYEKKAPI